MWLGLTGRGTYGDQRDSARIDEAGRELSVAGAPDDVSAAVVEAPEAVEPDVTGIVAVADASGLVLERIAVRRDDAGVHDVQGAEM